MKDRLGCLDSSKSYKLEFYLYSNTNDETKELIHLPKNDCVLFSHEYTDQTLNHFLALAQMETSYNFRGYNLVHSELFKRDSISDFNKHIYSIYCKLGGIVIHRNESLGRVYPF